MEERRRGRSAPISVTAKAVAVECGASVSSLACASTDVFTVFSAMPVRGCDKAISIPKMAPAEGCVSNIGTVAKLSAPTVTPNVENDLDDLFEIDHSSLQGRENFSRLLFVWFLVF